MIVNLSLTSVKDCEFESYILDLGLDPLVTAFFQRKKRGHEEQVKKMAYKPATVQSANRLNQQSGPNLTKVGDINDQNGDS